MKIETAAFEAAAALSSQLLPPDLPEVAFSGRSKALARTSATPGKTATINFYRLDTMRMIDLPGYGYAKVSHAEKRRWATLIEGYFEADRDLRLTLQLVDMRHPPTADDRMMIEYMTETGIPFVIVLTKADKLNKTQRAQRLESLQQELADYEGIQTIPFSAVTGEGVDTLRDILVSVTEDIDE